jgi:hypothetical protein
MAQPVTWLDESSATRAVVLERMAVEAAARLAQAGVEVRVLKGVALSHLAYDDPGERDFVDVDVLVRGCDWDAACRELSEAGYVPRLPPPRPGFDRRFGKDATFVNPEGYELDVHRTICRGALGLTIDLDELFSHTQPLRLAGRTLLALDDESALLNACYAVWSDDPPRAVSVLDIVRLVLVVGVDQAEVLRRARSWRADAVLAHGLLLGAELEPDASHPLFEWASAYVPTHWDRCMRWTYRGPERSYRSQLASLLVIPGVRSKAAYLIAALFPSAEYLASRGWTRAHHVRLAIRRVLGWRR